MRLSWSFAKSATQQKSKHTSQPKKRSSALLAFLEAKLNLKLHLLLLDSSCSLLFLGPGLGLSGHFAEGKPKCSGKWLTHSQTVIQPQRNSLEPGPSASSVRGLIPKVTYYHLELFSPRLVLGVHHPAPRWPCWGCSSSTTSVGKFLEPEVWEQTALFLHSHPEMVIWTVYISSLRFWSLGLHVRNRIPYSFPFPTPPSQPPPLSSSPLFFSLASLPSSFFSIFNGSGFQEHLIVE